jgi:activating signal cointegrator 1
MKVISLLQPWASLVVAGHKRIETRSWNTKHKGDLLIHASKKFDKSQRAICFARFFEPLLADVVEELPLGAIIGKVKMIGTNTTESILNALPDSMYWGKEQEQAFGDYSQGRYGWYLTDAIQFGIPIPAKGALSIWDWNGIIPDQAMLSGGKILYHDNDNNLINP